MGGVAVLHPQDLFNHNHHRHQFISPAMKSHSARRNLHPAPSRSCSRRKRSPQKTTTLPSKRSNHPRNSSPSSKPTGNGPVIVVGPIKILKRGEALPVSTTPPSLDLTPLKEEQQQPPPPVQKAPANSTTKKKKMGAGVPRELAVLSAPEPELKQIQRISDCYAGSAFISSPPPSSLPVPAFFRKKNLVLTDDDNAATDSNSDDDATSDLLRLLRLDLS
ncbi:unnamed protein product [Coffea canephora]|uniref:Uncharacterized protein n=1 Tax=Coffea canephora TaxID=49390 RepID=A0A068VE29_COFCA|nr:unnamed protein product [Coffea canephora]